MIARRSSRMGASNGRVVRLRRARSGRGDLPRAVTGPGMAVLLVGPAGRG